MNSMKNYMKVGICRSLIIILLYIKKIVNTDFDLENKLNRLIDTRRVPKDLTLIYYGVINKIYCGAVFQKTR